MSCTQPHTVKMNDVVGPLPHRMDGRLAELPPEALYPKYARLLELKSVKNMKKRIYLTMKTDGERLDTARNDIYNQLDWWCNERERLRSLPPHPERDRRILFADRAIAGSQAELKKAEEQQEAQTVKIAKALEELWKAKGDLGEYMMELCK